VRFPSTWTRTRQGEETQLNIVRIDCVGFDIISIAPSEDMDQRRSYVYARVGSDGPAVLARTLVDCLAQPHGYETERAQLEPNYLAVKENVRGVPLRPEKATPFDKSLKLIVCSSPLKLMQDCDLSKSLVLCLF
jgi:hypothetical protein